MLIRLVLWTLFIHLFYPSIGHGVELEFGSWAGEIQGPKKNGEAVFDFSEKLVKPNCKGSVRLKPCQSLSERFYDLAQYDLGDCFERAFEIALPGNQSVKSIEIHGEVYGSGQTANGFWRLHNWRRAMDIYKVRINGNKTMIYEKATNDWKKNKTDSEDYIFWREFRNCWGSWGSKASLWFKNNSAHYDHIHISTPFTQPWSYINGVAAR